MMINISIFEGWITLLSLLNSFSIFLAHINISINQFIRNLFQPNSLRSKREMNIFEGCHLAQTCSKIMNHGFSKSPFTNYKFLSHSINYPENWSLIISKGSWLQLSIKYWIPLSVRSHLYDIRVRFLREQRSLRPSEKPFILVSVILLQLLKC